MQRFDCALGLGLVIYLYYPDEDRYHNNGTCDVLVLKWHHKLFPVKNMLTTKPLLGVLYGLAMSIVEKDTSFYEQWLYISFHTIIVMMSFIIIHPQLLRYRFFHCHTSLPLVTVDQFRLCAALLRHS